MNAAINKILSDSGNEVKLANSVWIRDGAVDVEENFLKTVKEIYNAEAYRSAFNAQTLKDVNNWCMNKTDGMIKDVLDEIDSRDMIYLINALLFDAKWQTEYEKAIILRLTAAKAKKSRCSVQRNPLISISETRTDF